MTRKPFEISGRVEKISKGKYKLIAILGYKENGSAIRKTKNVEAKNLMTANQLLADFIDRFESVDSEHASLNGITFGDFYRNYWLKDSKDLIEPKTRHGYIKNIENRFLEKLDFFPMYDIKPYMIRKIINDAKRMDGKDKPLSNNSKRQMLFSVSSVFRLAKVDYTIIKENPCDPIEPKKTRGEVRRIEEPYSEEEIESYLKAAMQEDKFNRALFIVAFYTAARESEIVALEEPDILFETEQIRFHQRISEVDNKSDVRLMPGLKNGDEEKVITLPSVVFPLLKELITENTQHRWKLQIKRPEHTFLFDAKQDGTLPRGSYLYKRFKRFTKKHGLRHIRFHDIRHTSATYLLNDPNTTTTEVQHLLGHRSQSTTTEIYGHVLQTKKKPATTTAFEKLDISTK